MINILLAVYNNSEYLEAQLHSLLKQTHPHFHITARDDCSTDHSLEILEAFAAQHPNKITLIKGDRNLGAKGNFSFLVDQAQGDYVMFCDGDDVWLPTKIEESLALMHKNETLYGKETPILIHTDLVVVDKNLNTLSPSFWSYSNLNPCTANQLNRLLTHNVITGCTLLINRSLLQLASPIPKEAIMHDWWIGLTASAFGRIDFLKKATILYRQHGRNDIGAKNWRSWKTYWNAFKKTFHTEGRDSIRQRLVRTMEQASLFDHRYGKELPVDKQRLVHSYATLKQAGGLAKRYFFFRHAYFKNSFAKNAGMFFFL